MGVMGFLGIKLTMVSTLLPPLIIATGSSYSIRLFNQHLLDLEYTHKAGKFEGLKRSLYSSFPIILLAGLTTFIGFMTMVVNRIPALSDLGLLAALGTALSVIVSVILIICVIYLAELLPVHVDRDGEEKRKPNVIVSGTVNFCSRITLKYHTPLIVITAITLALSIIGISRVTTETSATSFFKKDSYVRKSLSRTNELFKGTYIINVIFSPGDGKNIYDHDFLQYIEDVRLWLDQPGQDTDNRILYNSGFGDFIKRMNKAMNNEDPEFYSIPDTMTIMDYMELFSGDDDNGDGRADMFETVISPGSDKTNLMVRIGTYGDEVMTTKKSQMTIDHICKYLDTKPNPMGYKYMITGGPTNFNIVSRYIIQGQIEAILLSISIIFVLMFALYRNLGASVASLVPITCTVMWIFGIMGFSGIPLGMAQTLVASIAIGVGVDDTIQFTITLRRNLRNGMDFRDAVRATHLEAGLAVIYTSVALMFGFAVFVFSTFTPIQESGLLVSGVIFFVTMANLILLPSFILTFRLSVHRNITWRILDILKLHYLLDEKD
jgi:predicted RND superfamily exporter protein